MSPRPKKLLLPTAKPKPSKRGFAPLKPKQPAAPSNRQARRAAEAKARNEQGDRVVQDHDRGGAGIRSGRVESRALRARLHSDRGMGDRHARRLGVVGGSHASATPICIDWSENDGVNDAVRQPNGDILFLDTKQTFRKGQEAEALARMVEQYEMRAGLRKAWNGTDAAKKPTGTQPVQEPQFGPHIDSMPIERNAPAPAGAGVAVQESKEKKDRVRS